MSYPLRIGHILEWVDSQATAVDLMLFQEYIKAKRSELSAKDQLVEKRDNFVDYIQKTRDYKNE